MFGAPRLGRAAGRPDFICPRSKGLAQVPKGSMASREEHQQFTGRGYSRRRDGCEMRTAVNAHGWGAPPVGAKHRPWTFTWWNPGNVSTPRPAF